MNPYISIIIPAYNEAGKIKDTLENIKCIDEINEIIVVDDGSSDDTSKIASSVESEKLKLFTLERNKGKGYALNYGLKIAMEKADIIGFLDGDLGNSSKEVKKLIDPILNNEADVIIAKFPPAKKKGGLGFVKGLAKESVLEMTGKELDATLSGQRLFKKEVLKRFDEIPFGYGVEVGMTIEAKESVLEMTGKELDATLSGQRLFKKEVLKRFDEIPFGYGVEVGMTIDILKYGYTIKEVLVNMTHSETGRDLKGFIHRGKQYYHIKKVLKQKRKEWR